MKGYVNVSVEQISQAVDGFKSKYAEGKRIRDKGIELYYIKNYIGGSWLTRFFSRKCTPVQFARKNCSFGSWDNLLHTVLSVEESDILSWWCWTNENEMSNFSSLISQSRDGIALVDHSLAKMINEYRGWKK